MEGLSDFNRDCVACKIFIMWSLIESLLTSSLVGQGGFPGELVLKVGFKMSEH